MEIVVVKVGCDCEVQMQSHLRIFTELCKVHGDVGSIYNLEHLASADIVVLDAYLPEAVAKIPAIVKAMKPNAILVIFHESDSITSSEKVRIVKVASMSRADSSGATRNIEIGVDKNNPIGSGDRDLVEAIVVIIDNDYQGVVWYDF